MKDFDTTLAYVLIGIITFGLLAGLICITTDDVLTHVKKLERQVNTIPGCVCE